MRFLCQLAVFLLGQLLLCSGLVAQDVQLDFRHFTTDDGLPSSEVYTVLEDQEGYIWVGTDNGVARFDGYSFEVFDSDDGLGDVVVFYLIMDDEGTVWAGTYSGRIFYFKEGRFIEFEHNDKIASLRVKGEFIHLADIKETGELIIRFQRTGIYSISQEGVVEAISSDDPTHYYIYAREMRPDGSADIPSFRRGYLNNIRTGYNETRSIKFMIGSTDQWIDAGNIQITPSLIGISRTLTSANLLPGRKLFVIFSNKSMIWSQDKPSQTLPFDGLALNQFISTSENTGWALMNLNKGLYHLTFDADFSSVTSDTLLKGVSLSHGIFDRNGGMWLSSLNYGLFYCPLIHQRKYTAKPESKTVSIETFGKNGLYTGLSNGEILHSHVVSENRLELSGSFGNGQLPVDLLFYDESTKVAYGTSFKFIHPNQSDGKRIIDYYNKLDDEGLRYLQALREINHSSHVDFDSLLICNRTSFGLLNRNTGQTRLLNVTHESEVYGLESFYIDKDNRYLLGTVTGLKEFLPDGEGAQIVDVDLGVKELRGRIVKIMELKDGNVVFGTRGNGIVHLGKDTTVIRQSDGLASDMVRHLHQADDGAIWVSTLNGLSKVELKNDSFTVRTFRTENGLIDNEVHMVDTYGDAIYLATSSGVQRFVEPEVNPFSSPPVIRQITVDGENMPMAERLRLKPGNHTLNLSFSTINHKLGSKINYRYRLDDQDDWSYTQQRTVAFPRLNPGEFNFTVQSQNEDGFWSEDSSLIIDIPKRWYNTVYALVGLLFILGSVMAAIFYIREQRRKKEQDLFSQISKLEHEALHARMNPHFVFNCLNSIQNFVLENDTRSAATYLSRFSSLIRQILRSSVDGKHTLREEVQMLEKYLELEKLRFKTAFTYTITVDASLDEDGISLAPLLIQPFVENAILHGMKGRKVGGKISIDFAGSYQELRVTVTDNGKGIDRSQPKKKDSMGMDITLQRLSVMQRENEISPGMTVEPIYSNTGKVSGTKVVLRIVPETVPTA